MGQLKPSDQRFVDQAIRREKLFFRLSAVSVFVGLATIGIATTRYLHGEEASATFVIAILILLNARQNLRQHKYARALRVIGAGSVNLEASDDG